MYLYVIVWENNTHGHRAVKGHTWPGHAAINIGDTFDKVNKRGKHNYVSWWPDKAVGFNLKGILKSAFTPARAGETHVSITEDVESEEYLPDHVIRLATDAGQERTMQAAWREVYLPANATDRKYKAIRRNCSTIVSRILHAGGFESKKWSVQNQFAWSPADIRVLARRVGGRFMKWTEFLEVLNTSAIDPNTWEIKQARSGALCTTGAPCRFQTDAGSFFWANK